MSTTTALPTVYQGINFRSRLEARWAMVFDDLGIQWRYEPEGYAIGLYQEINYLPDFFLPQTETWVEVKGDPDNDARLKRIILAQDYGHGLPGMEGSASTTRGLLILSDLPKLEDFQDGHIPVYPIVQHRKGLILFPATIGRSGPIIFESYQWGDLPLRKLVMQGPSYPLLRAANHAANWRPAA